MRISRSTEFGNFRETARRLGALIKERTGLSVRVVTDTLEAYSRDTVRFLVLSTSKPSAFSDEEAASVTNSLGLIVYTDTISHSWNRERRAYVVSGIKVPLKDAKRALGLEVAQ